MKNTQNILTRAKGNVRPRPVRLLRAVAKVALVQPRPAPHIVCQWLQEQAGEGGGVVDLLTSERVEPSCESMCVSYRARSELHHGAR